MTGPFLLMMDLWKNSGSGQKNMTWLCLFWKIFLYIYIVITKS